MAIRNIVKEGNETLRKVSKPVTDFNQKLEDLLDDMLETMRVNNGCGIAAVQVGILRRIFIVEVDGMKVEFINPVMLEQTGKCVGPEGCLSVPNRSGNVERPTKIRIKYFNRYGEEMELTATGFTARAICHEYDHLEGVLFIDKVVK